MKPGRRHSAVRPKVSGKTAFFPRNDRPYGSKCKAFQTENALVCGKEKTEDIARRRKDESMEFDLPKSRGILHAGGWGDGYKVGIIFYDTFIQVDWDISSYDVI